MFDKFSNLKDSLVDINGVDIDNAFNDLVEYINKIDTRLTSILENSNLDVEDGVLCVKNNTLTVSKNIDTIFKENLSDILSNEETEGILVTDDVSKIKLKPNDDDDVFVKLTYNGILYDSLVPDNYTQVQLEKRLIKDNMFSLKHVDFETLKTYLSNLAYNRGPIDVNYNEKLDLTDLTTDQVQHLKSIEIPDSALSDDALKYSFINTEKNQIYYSIDKKLPPLRNILRIEGNTYDLYNVEFDFELLMKQLGQLNTQLEYDKNQNSVSPSKYFDYYRNNNNISLRKTTLNLNYTNFNQTTMPLRYQLLTCNKFNDSNNPFYVAVDIGKIDKSKLSEELRNKLKI